MSFEEMRTNEHSKTRNYNEEEYSEESVVSRELSYRIVRMAIVRCRFIFLGFDWFRLFFCYLRF